MKRVSYHILSLALVTGLFASCGDNNEVKDTQEIAEDKNDAKFNSADAEKSAQFLVEATNESYKEIEAAKVVAARSTNPAVKELANTLVADHEKNLADLKQVAAAKSISVPTSPTEDALEISKKWNEVKADKLDKDFIQEISKNHKDHISDLESKLTSINDVDIQNYINNTLSKLRTHYDKIVSIENTLK